MAIKVSGTAVIDGSRNIVNVGTVDGRDVAADGSKLDGIEATADVTDAGNVNPLVDTHLNTSSATTGEYLSWTGSDYDWVAVSGYTDADVDTHLNTGTAASGEVLSWNGSDYDWVSGGATSLGDLSDANTTANNSVSLRSSHNSAESVFILGGNSSAYQAIAIGYLAGSGASGTGNVNVGYATGRNVTGLKNVYIGYNAGGYTGSSRTGDGNVFISPRNSGWHSITTGEYNVALGMDSSASLTTGLNNVHLGRQAGDATTTGSNQIVIGQGADASSATVSNEITLGNNSITRFRIPAAGIDNTSDALSGTTPSVDVGARDTYTLSTSGNTTFTFTGAPSSGQVGTFSLIITAGGTHTLTWPASVDWAGGTAPDAPASGEKDIYTFMTVDGGTTWYGFLAGDAMA